MKRRRFLIGLGGASAGGSVLLGSGAFSRVESDRYMTIEVAEDPDAYLGLDACDSPNGDYVEIDEEGHLYVDIGETTAGGEGVNSNSRTWFDELIQLCNQGTDDACIWIERGDDWPTVEEGEHEGEPRVDFYLGEDEESILGEDNATEIELGECECIGVRTNTHGVDATAEETLLEEVDDVVTLVADVDCPDPGPQPGQAFFEVSDIEPAAISVEPGETFSISATITNAGDEAGTQDVTLQLDGENVDSQELSLDPDDEEVTFEDVETDDLDDGEYTYTVSTDDDEASGTLTIEGAGPIEVLFLGGVEDAADHPSEELLQVLAPYMLERGIRLYYTEREAELNPDTLEHYDAVLHYGNRYDPVEEQIDALVEFVEDGGGFVPVHSASFSYNTSEAYTSLVGGVFSSHGDAEMSTERVEHPVFENVEEITAYEETYRHTDLNDDIEVLATATGGDYEEDEEEPFTWVREQGDGRVFYTAWGHYPAEEDGVWEMDGFLQLLTNGIRWSIGNEDELGDFEVEEDFPEKTYTDVSEYGHDAIPHYASFSEPYGQEPPEELDPDDDGEWELVQDPFEVEESMAHSIVPAAFDLEYFVSEDDYPDGVEGEIMDIAFDAAGRCYVTVSQDYPNDAGDGNDAILLCEDTDGDGIADDVSVFKDDLSIPLTIVPYEDGVIAAELVSFDENDGRVVYFGDEDGDGVADVEEEIFTGIGTGDTHAGLNQLYWGHDNWIYGVVGYEGLDPSIAEDLSLSQDVFRFRPDGSAIEHVGNLPTNTAGVKTNEEGLVFVSAATAGDTVNAYVAIPSGYYDYIEGFEGSSVVDIRSETNFSYTDDSNRFLPINNRYRQVDFHGGFTAATDQEIYTAREFPEQYWNRTTFVSDGTGQLTSTFYMEQEGASYVSNYFDNLFASNDEWSSPTYVHTGPDGMVWVVDMYNFIFQHNPNDVPRYDAGDGNAYASGVREAGDEYGRLYRITSESVDPHPQDLSGASASELVDALSDDNMFWRRTAQRLLIERGETDVVDDLIDEAVSEDVDEIGIDGSSIHALWTLEGLDAVEDNAEALHDALSHSSAGVRINAIRVLPPTAATRDAILDAGLLEDDDGRVTMWAFLKLAETPESDAAGAAIFEAIDDEDALEEDLLVDAASIAGATHAQGFIDAYRDEYGQPREGVNVFEGNNGSFEETAPTGPEDWSTTTYSGTAEHTWAEGTANSGTRSLRISSSEGSDASWNQTVSVESDTEYTLSGYIKTEDIETLDDTGFSDITPFGAVLNVDQVGGASDADVVTDPLTGTNDWTEVSVTFNSGDNTELTVNGLFGGFGEATGTAWYDDISLQDPDGNELLANNDVEDGTTEELPAGWSTQNFSDTADAEFALDTEDAQFGSNSARISSEEGLDGAWYATVSIEDDNEYELVGWIETENVQNVQGDEGLGALFNIHGTARGDTEFQTDVLTGTNDWTEVSTTFDSGDLPSGAWTDGPGSSIRINALFGGFGLSTGTAWFDGVALYDPDGEPQGENLLTNPSMEEGDDSPDAWSTNEFAGTVDEFTWAEDTASDGSRSLAITASGEGADAAWQQFVEVEPNQQYELSGMIMTEDVETIDETGHDGIEDAPFGAVITVGNIANASYPDLNYDAITDWLTGTEDWTEVSTTFNSGPNEELDINALYGAYGNATGTAYWDEMSLIQLTEAGTGIEQVYNRVLTHLEETGLTASFTASATSVSVGEEVTFDASDSSSPDGSIESYEWDFGDDSTDIGETVTHAYDDEGEYTVELTVTDDDGDTDTATTTIEVGSDVPPGAIEPGTAIELDGQTAGWVGIAPDSIEDEENPTLTLVEGESYELGWTTGDGAPHNIEIRDEDGEVVDDLATETTNAENPDDQWLEFEASEAMVTYVCEIHPTSMVGDIELV